MCVLIELTWLITENLLTPSRIMLFYWYDMKFKFTKGYFELGFLVCIHRYNLVELGRFSIELWIVAPEQECKPAQIWVAARGTQVKHMIQAGM